MRRCAWYPLARRRQTAAVRPAQWAAGSPPPEHAYHRAHLDEPAARGRARVTSAFCWPATLSPRSSTGLPLGGMRGFALSGSYPPVKCSLRSLLSMHFRELGVATASEALAAICLRHGLNMEARVIQDWLETRSLQRSHQLRDKVRDNGVPHGGPMRSGAVRTWLCRAKVTGANGPSNRAPQTPRTRDEACPQVRALGVGPRTSGL